VPTEKKAEGHEGISAGELRALARKTGRFAETGKVFDLLIATGLPEAAAQRAGLEADRAEVAAEPATAHLARAAELAPRNWEFARRLAEAQLSAGEGGKARQTVERFLGVAVVSRDRPAALELWERAKH